MEDDEIERRCGLEAFSTEEIIQIIESYPDDTLLVSPILSELCDRNNAEHVNNFDKDIHGFTAETDYVEANVVFFSIPADEGWQITIDGNETDFIDAGGLLLINVPGGKHRIRGEYHCPFFQEGCFISIGFFLLFVILFALCSKLLI